MEKESKSDAASRAVHKGADVESKRKATESNGLITGNSKRWPFVKHFVHNHILSLAASQFEWNLQKRKLRSKL